MNDPTPTGTELTGSGGNRDGREGHRRVHRALRASLMALPVACLAIAGCSGGSSTPKAQGPPSVAATTSPTATPAATPTSTNSIPCDSCGQTEPVFFVAGSYTGTRPAEITIDGIVCSGLTWSSWPSGPNGSIPSGSTVEGTGTTDIDGSSVPVTITLGDPVAGTPSSWQSLDLHISGQAAEPYQLSSTGVWKFAGPNSASGGEGGGYNAAVTITASGGDQPQ
jgi:hypothetical protein